MYAVFKRIFDIVLSAAACIVLLPAFIVLAIAIRYESPGSPIFTQERIGQFGRPFHIMKFRSMVKDAPALGSWQTAQNDPRITRVGKFIRTTSLDELPQLWNVLIGNMSLIGPRPEVPARETAYTPGDWKLRHRVRPGITGLAQVSGRSALTEAEQLRYDLAYAVKPTLATDIYVLLKTVQVVAQRTGVN